MYYDVLQCTIAYHDVPECTTKYHDVLKCPKAYHDVLRRTMLEGEKLEGARLLRSCSLCQVLTPPCCSAELVQVGDVPVEALQFRYEQQ